MKKQNPYPVRLSSDQREDALKYGIDLPAVIRDAVQRSIDKAKKTDGVCPECGQRKPNK